MTVRQELVDTEDTVLTDVTVCDGCGRHVDMGAPESTEWTPSTPDEDPVHTCENCSVRNITQYGTGVLGTLRRWVPEYGGFAPEQPVLLTFALLMAGVTGGLVMTDVVETTAFQGAFLLVLLIGGLVTALFTGLGAAEVDGQDGPYEQLVLLPAGILLALLVMPTAAWAWATVVASFWMMAAYAGYRYEVDLQSI